MNIICSIIFIACPLFIHAESQEKLELQADIFIAKGEFDHAAEVYRKLLEKSPDDYGRKLKLAEVLSWSKQYPESVQVYQELITQFPKDEELRRKYAMVLMWMGDEGAAAKELEKTLK
jgi:tetratricopeptide (TPR) repeat protein